MPTTVEIPQVGTVEFPEGMSDEDISSTIQNDIIPRASKKAALQEEMQAARSEIIPRVAETVAGVAENVVKGISQANPLTYLPHLAFELDRQLGVVTKDQENPIDANKPLATPEAVTHVLDMVGGPPEIGSAMRGARDFTAETVSSMSSPNMVAALASGGAPAAARATLVSAFTGQMAAQAPEAYQQFQEARQTGTSEDVARTGLNLLMTAGIPTLVTVGALKGALPTRLEKTAPETAQALKETGVENAQQIESPTQLHGDVSPQPRESQVQVPTEVSSETLRGGGQASPPQETPGAPVEPTPEFIGMGGATPTEFGTTSISELTDMLRNQPPSEKMPLLDRLRIGERAADTITAGKERWENTLAKARSAASTIYEAVALPPQWTEFKRILGEYRGQVQNNDLDLMRFVDQANETIPNDLKREAIINWIQAEGDNATLAARAAASKEKLAPGYEEAQRLTPEEQNIARQIGSFLDSRLQEGINAGILQSGVENYFTQIWKEPNPITNRLISDISTGKLPANFRFARKRIFESYFEGEQAGYAPAKKDFASVLAAYDQAFNRSLAARAFIRNLKEGTAEDGRPFVELEGGRTALPKDETPPQAILVNSRIKPEEAVGYGRIDHPALRGWKWAHTDPNGTTVFYKSDLLVHPEIYTHLKNVLSTSAFRQNDFVRQLMDVQRFAKQSKLSLSLFHQVQEGVHAIFHTVKPWGMPEINLDDPIQHNLATHGLQIADYHAWSDFSEGLGGKGGLWERLMPFLQTYNSYLFQDYIPRLKMSMALEAYKRNVSRYSSKMTEDQLLELTARQANAAFGEQDYKFMGRNPTFQDFLRIVNLSPDFTESRGRFVAQAFTRYGGEQRRALALMAATLWVGSRIINKASTGDPQWDKPFTVIIGKKEFGLRTIAGDVQHLFEDWHQFTQNRISPAMRAIVETYTGRDARGIKRSSWEQLGDLANWLAPISLESLSPLSSRYGKKTMTENLLAATGVFSLDASPNKAIFQLARKWKEDTGNLTKEEKAGVMIESDYKPLRQALLKDDYKDAKEQFDKLVASGKTADKIFSYFSSRIDHPVTGITSLEKKFVASLSEKEKMIYDSAHQERLDTFKALVTMAGGKKPMAPKSVDVPGVGTVQFPGEMSNEEIASTIKNDIMPKKK